MVKKIIAIVVFECSSLKCSIASVRRRRPSSSSSVRPSVPSVRRRRRRRPLSVRPSRPSVVVRRRRLPANPRPHANFRKKTSKYESYGLGTMKFG